MKKEPMNSNPSLSKNKRSSNTSLQTFDLPSIIKKMKHKQSWVDGELNATILLKSPEKQIMLTALHEGTEIKSFQSNESITFQIIEGKLMFHTRKESATLNKGQLLTLHDKIKYSLVTKEDTVFLLTIASEPLQPTDCKIS
jgi:quercetin dioxygenase-like cupin family protein